MRRAYKFRLRPTARQHVALERCLTAHRELYNAALQERREAYTWEVRRSPDYYSTTRPKCSVRYTSQAAQLSEIRSERTEIAEWSFSSQQATLRRLDKAFEAFFRRVSGGQTAGYPRFKSAHRFDSVEWPKDRDGCRWHPEARRVYLQGIGHVKVSMHRAVEGGVKTISIKRDGRRWFLVLSCDDVPTKPLPPTGQSGGLDMGVRRFLTESDGSFTENPRHGRAASERLAAAQRRLATKKCGSNNRTTTRATVAKRHRKVANQRLDFHNKEAIRLVRKYDWIAIEHLNIANMTKRVSARANPENPRKFLSNGQAAKAGINKSIIDAGWGAFFTILRAKAEEAGREVLSVDPKHTSDSCNECEHTARENRKGERFCCLGCGHVAHADHNAAQRIHGAGLALRGPAGGNAPPLVA